MAYQCKRCHYHTNFKSNLFRHLKNKKTCQALFSNDSTESLIHELEYTKQTTTCELCNTSYATTSNLRRHQNTCRMKSTTYVPPELNDILKTVRQLQQELRSKSNITTNNTTTNNITTNNTQHINICVNPQSCFL
jgi:hypothetical protein